MDLENLVFVYWHWWLVAVVLFIIELVVPGTFFLWMGVSALFVGALALVFPDLAISIELIVFAVFSVVSVIAWRSYQRKNPSTTNHPTLNRRGEEFLGRTITLVQPLVDGRGKEKVGATLWTLQGQGALQNSDSPAGTKVKIVGMDSAVLLVEKA